MDSIRYRHEWKHEIRFADLLDIRMRLRAVAEPDPHAVDGRYRIRSLYFDTPSDRALREKLDGVSRREKFRLRYYNGDTSLIHLEKKIRRGGLGAKFVAELTEAEARLLTEGETDWMRDCGRPLSEELYRKMQTERLAPRTLVDYIREPFVYGPGNVRVTLDYDIRTGLSSTDFLNPDCVMIPAGDAPVILEVKWDEMLPDIIRAAVQTPNVRAAAFSKYAQCRIYD